MPLPSRDEPPPDPHGFRDVIARRRKAAEDDRDRLRSFERACESSRDNLRRTARALESTAWTVVARDGASWRIQNVPEAGAAKQMVIALDEQGRMVLRQPNRMDEPMVFTRIAPAEDAAAWCVARAERDAAIEAAASGEEGAR